jgi:hypothetical protein
MIFYGYARVLVLQFRIQNKSVLVPACVGALVWHVVSYTTGDKTYESTPKRCSGIAVVGLYNGVDPGVFLL